MDVGLCDRRDNAGSILHTRCAYVQVDPLFYRGTPEGPRTTPTDG